MGTTSTHEELEQHVKAARVVLISTYGIGCCGDGVRLEHVVTGKFGAQECYALLSEVDMVDEQSVDVAVLMMAKPDYAELVEWSRRVCLSGWLLGQDVNLPHHAGRRRDLTDGVTKTITYFWPDNRPETLAVLQGMLGDQPLVDATPGESVMELGPRIRTTLELMIIRQLQEDPLVRDHMRALGRPKIDTSMLPK